MNRNEYREYLNHPLWIQKREEVFQAYGKKCFKCGSIKFLTIHHKTYAQGKMPWEYPIENFEVLCENCHDKTHSYEYIPNHCTICGKSISKNFSLCITCHNEKVKKLQDELNKRSTIIAELENKLKETIKTGKTVNETEIKILEKELETARQEKLKFEADLEKAGKAETQQIHGQLISLKRMITALSILIVVGLTVFIATLLTQKQNTNKPSPTQTSSQQKKPLATPQETAGTKPLYNTIKQMTGEIVTLEVRITQVYRSKNGNTYLNVGGRYPKQKLTLLIFKNNIQKFGNLKNLEDKQVRVTGKVTNYQGEPQIILYNKKQLEIL